MQKEIRQDKSGPLGDCLPLLEWERLDKERQTKHPIANTQNVLFHIQLEKVPTSLIGNIVRSDLRETLSVGWKTLGTVEKNHQNLCFNFCVTILHL